MTAPASDTLLLQSPALTARLDAATGRLLSIEDAHGTPLLLESSFRYRHAGVVFAEPDPRFMLRSLHVAPRRVRATSQNPHLRLTRDLALVGNGLFLRLRTRIEAITPIDNAVAVALPFLAFAEDMADPLGDERDHYFDGCELAPGVELPAWRVLFRRRSDEGLLLAATCREHMAKMQILPEGLEVTPHHDVLYKMDHHARFPPLSLTPGRALHHEVFLAPWSRRTHDDLVAALGLDLPRRRRRAPVLSAAPPTLPEGHVFDPTQNHAITPLDTFDEKSWRVIAAPWSPTGRALYAPSPAFPPAVHFLPRLAGNYRILLTLGPSSAPLVRLDGEPLYRLISAFPGTPLSRLFTDPIKPHVVDFGVHRLTENSLLQIERTPERHDHTFIAEVRLVPDDTPPAKPRAGQLTLHSFIDTPDIGMLLTDCRKPSIEPYRETIRQHARMGFSTLIWRIDGQVTEYPTNVATRRYTYGKVHGVYNPSCKEGGRIARRHNLLQEAVDAARQNGLKIVGWMRFNSYWGNVQSGFFREHPEFWETWENGSVGRKLCLAHPEVRKHKRDILIEAARYGLDGLNLGFLRHPPVLHRAPILVQSFRERFGEDPPLHDFRALGVDLTKSLPPTDEASVRWFKHRAGFLTTFMRELKADFQNAGMPRLPVSIWVRPNHCLFDGIDLETWLKEGLCDAVYSESPIGTAIGEPAPEWEAMVRKHVPLIRGVTAFRSAEAIEHLPRFLDRYDGVSVYEGNVAVFSPPLISLFERELARREARDQ